jgi:hypothetical protein
LFKYQHNTTFLFKNFIYILCVKVEELEKRLENSTTATAQKQLQLDTMQQALEKLKRQVGRDEHIHFSFVGR